MFKVNNLLNILVIYIYVTKFNTFERYTFQLIEEESANLKQKRMEFEFEKATFNKQTEFAKNVLKKQDEEIKVLFC